MKRTPLLIIGILVLSLLSLLCVGCASPSPFTIPTAADAQAALTATKATAQAVAAVEATQPGAASVVKAADNVVNAVDVATPIVAKVDTVSGQVAALQTSVADLASQNATLQQKLSDLGDAVKAGAAITHTVAPNTPADNYAAIAASVVTIAALFLGHKTTTAAINAPGTTPAIDASSKG